MQYNNVKLNENDFNKVSKIIYDKFGIKIPESKKVLLESRLSSILRNNEIESYSSFLKNLEKGITDESFRILADRISTNHTYFFREDEHLKFLGEIFKTGEYLQNKFNKKLRIWSAGCSSGEEAYSIAMTADNVLSGSVDKTDVKILGTDISTTALSKAIHAKFTKQEIEKIPISYRNKYIKNIDGISFSISDRIRDYVVFKWLNLMDPMFPFKGKFDFIFCRNVMIYFDENSTIKLLNRFYNYLEKGGILFIGHTETIHKKMRDKFAFVRPGIFYKK